MGLIIKKNRKKSNKILVVQPCSARHTVYTALILSEVIVERNHANLKTAVQTKIKQKSIQGFHVQFDRSLTNNEIGRKIY